MKSAIPELRAAFEARGRDPQQIHIAPMGVLPEREKLDYYESLGVTEAVLRLPSGPRDRVLPVLDEFTRHLC